MSHVHRLNFRAQHIRSALFPLVFLMSLILPTLLIAPVQAMHATPPPPSPTDLGDPRELTSSNKDIGNAEENKVKGAFP